MTPGEMMNSKSTTIQTSTAKQGKDSQSSHSNVNEKDEEGLEVEW